MRFPGSQSSESESVKSPDQGRGCLSGLSGMSSRWVGLLVLLAFSEQILAPAGQERLQPPRNLTLVPEDFRLFLTWQPADDHSPGVTYTVKWWNAFLANWSTSRCVGISATSCDVTCLGSEPGNRFKVQVEAQERTGRTSTETLAKWIDYDVDVELAPPVLQVGEAESLLIVNTTFTYPSCVKSFFHDLVYDLEFWGNGTKPKTLKNMMEKVVSISTTQFRGSSYCLRSQAFLHNRKKGSRFSEPVCGTLQEEEAGWRLTGLLSLLLVPAGGALMYISWYKTAAAKHKMPQVLDFSSYKGPKKFLEFGERDLVKVDVLVCERKPVVSEIRRKPAPQINLALTPSACSAVEEEEEEEEEDEDDDDSGIPIPYTELRFPKKDVNCQWAGRGEKNLGPPSEPDSGFTDALVSKHFVSSELEIGKSASELQDSQQTSLSSSSSAEELLLFPVGCPATRGLEDLNGDIDFSVSLSTVTEGRSVSLPTETPFVTAIDFPEGSWGNLDDSQRPLLDVRSREDAGGNLPEEQTEAEREFESAPSGCGGLVKEMLLLKVSSLEGVESCTLGGNRNLEAGRIPGPQFHGYQPRHTLYISKTVLG